jgi:hypothetical protein
MQFTSKFVCNFQIIASSDYYRTMSLMKRLHRSFDPSTSFADQRFVVAVKKSFKTWKINQISVLT